ncbi:12088_t:CDS:2 [Entrophospora sp. SA101]|nr:12088_t:CDS:2 [Entrophospora sp. SA101]
MQSSDSPSQTTSWNVKRYKPFWDEFAQKLTNWCWLPLKTNSEVLCLSQWSDSLKRLALGSWVTVDSIKPTPTDLSNLPLLPDGTWNDFKDAISSKENLTSPSSFDAIPLSSAPSSKKSPAGKTHKIRFCPNSEFRSKKDKSQCITILSRDWGRNRGHYSFLKGIKTSEKIPEINYELRLAMNRLGPKFSIVEENKGVDIISLDPRV